MDPMGMIIALQETNRHLQSARPDAPVEPEQSAKPAAKVRPANAIRRRVARVLRRLADRVEPCQPAAC
ncbi:MAG TPA: hypothetical protein VFX61_05045 [Micromonosporaceae bacterium]|nr:hypothetical protein [Micromonosporaceae bacterium]